MAIKSVVNRTLLFKDISSGTVFGFPEHRIPLLKVATSPSDKHAAVTLDRGEPVVVKADEPIELLSVVMD